MTATRMMKPPVQIHLIHGFLGLPSDWNGVRAADGVELKAVDAFRILSPATGSSMSDWAGAFNESVSATPARRVLVGYSMGGRLALHALARNPSLWDAAVIISTNPGIPNSEREARISSDELWARRFEREPWDQLVRAWENLPVFAGRPIPLARPEKRFSRAALAGALRVWSTGRQLDLTPRISEFPMPILWIAGEHDTRYAQAARRIQGRLNPTQDFELWIAPNAAHRVPWEAPLAFEEHFWRFLNRVLLNET